MLKLQDLKTSVRRRLEFIEFQLTWEGSVGRKKLQDQFGISQQQATNDLTAYSEACPRNMTYDPRQKHYVPAPNFRPRLTRGEALEYLMHLDMLHFGYRDKNEVWVTMIPSFDAVSIHSRRICPKVLKDVLGAMRSGSWLRVQYDSLSSDDTGYRTLRPHSIASDGHRWHIRAFDLEKTRYSDFVLSRLNNTGPGEAPRCDVPDDKIWNTTVAVMLTADPSLNKRGRHRLEYEYGMSNGRLRLKVRQAMLFYYLRHFGFDPLEIENGTLRNKSSFHLSIENIEEVEEWLGRR